MRDYLAENWNQILDGLLFGLGVLAVYLGAVITGSIIRSLGGAGSKGLTVLGRYVAGWFDYVRGDDRNTINVTLNMVVDGHLKFDTIVADRRVSIVWPNAYRVSLIRRAAKRTTLDNPVIEFPQPQRDAARSASASPTCSRASRSRRTASAGAFRGSARTITAPPTRR